MTLSFDPKDSYVDMIMKLSDAKVIRFFNELGIDIDLDRPLNESERDLLDDVYYEVDDERLIEEG